MGTRQYGDDAPESKRKSQTAKAANTTTITLGVRLAGMQVKKLSTLLFSVCWAVFNFLVHLLAY